MNFAVMSTAQWDRELITHLASKCSALCKSEVVRIGRTPTANQTRMSCDEFHMLSIADSTRLRMGKTAFFDLSIVEVLVDSDPFRSSDVAWLRIDPKGDGCGSVLSTPSSSSANLAWNAFSNCRASATFNEFLAGRIRRAQMAAASTELTSLSSPRSWSRNTADNWLFRPALAELTCSFVARSAEIFRPKYFRPPFGRLRRFSSGFTAPGLCRLGCVEVRSIEIVFARNAN